jgi:hypothetical protein
MVVLLPAPLSGTNLCILDQPRLAGCCGIVDGK